MFNSRSFIKSAELVFYANPADLKTFMKAFAVCFIRWLSHCESSIIIHHAIIAAFRLSLHTLLSLRVNHRGLVGFRSITHFFLSRLMFSAFRWQITVAKPPLFSRE